MKNAKRIIELIYTLDNSFSPVSAETIITASTFISGDVLKDEDEVKEVLRKFTALEEEDQNITDSYQIVQDVKEQTEGLTHFYEAAEAYTAAAFTLQLENIIGEATKALMLIKKSQAEQIDSIIQKMQDPREFLAVWGNWEAAPNTYDDLIMTRSINAFTGMIGGYTVEDEAGIKALEVGETFKVSEGNHIVTRIK